MTENVQVSSSEELREQLEAARGELQGLLSELGHLDEREKDAIQADHERRMEVAREGGSIRQALTRKRSKVQEVRDRAEELPYFVWSAQVRVAELRRDYNEALYQELEPLVEPARQAADDPLRDVVEPVQAEQARLRGESGSAVLESGSAFQQKRDAELALERLEYAGPEVPVRPEVIR